MSTGKLKTTSCRNAIVIASALVLGACGTTPQERGVSGVGVGAGAFGPKTERAIRACQKDHGLLVDGRPTPELAAHISRKSG